MKNPEPRWWEARRAHNTKPSTYRCPLCGEFLPALADHMLLFPEGDPGRRRHAHSACVMRARAAGGLPTKSEWEQAHAKATASARGAGPAGSDRTASRWWAWSTRRRG